MPECSQARRRPGIPAKRRPQALTKDPKCADDSLWRPTQANFREEFEGIDFPSRFAPRFNIAPSQPVLAICNDGKHAADFLLWGLVPSWAKDPSMGARLINARGETLAEKPAFRGAYKYKRCLIPADGFYEWKAQPATKAKVPHFIQLKTRQAVCVRRVVG